jgi:hypothetical protein
MMHNYNNFHAQTESVAGKKKISIGFQTTQSKKKNEKNVARRDLWRLTPSKWLVETQGCSHSLIAEL